MLLLATYNSRLAPIYKRLRFISIMCDVKKGEKNPRSWKILHPSIGDMADRNSP